MPTIIKDNLSTKAIPTRKQKLRSIIEDYPKGIDPHERYYRIIVGVNKYSNSTKYYCYRKDHEKHFIIDSVDFNSRKLDDQRFIFSETDYENLLDYLTQFDDSDLRTIAEIGRKEIDPISLLPIIGE